MSEAGGSVYYDAIRTVFLGGATALALVLVGPIFAIAVLASLTFLSYRFSDALLIPDQQRPSTSPPSSSSYNGVPDSLKKLNWGAISEVPGIDAERLKNTFENLYEKLNDGSLIIDQNGEWTNPKLTSTPSSWFSWPSFQIRKCFSKRSKLD